MSRTPVLFGARAAQLASSLLLLAVLCLPTGVAWGQAQPAGELELLQGQVKIRHETQSQIVSKVGAKVAVFAGDTVQTDKASRAHLVMRISKDEVSLYGNTLFQVQAATENQSHFGLNIGKVLFHVFAAAKRSAFLLQTPTAVMGVKGTRFVVGAAADTTFLLTLEGRVSMVNRALTALEVIASANEASVIRAGRPPTPPVTVSAADRDNIVKEQGLKSFEVVPFPTTQAAPAPAPAPAQDSAGVISATKESVKEATQDALGTGGNRGGIGFSVK